MGIEPWDIFEFHILGTTLGADAVAGTDDDRPFRIQFRPIQPAIRSVRGGGINTMYLGTPQVTLFQQGSATSPIMIRVNIGRNYLDGSWHTIWLNLNEINREAHEGSVPAEWTLADATHIMAGGQMYRMDDIIFMRQDYARMQPPDMSETGPRYAQLFEPYR